MLEFSSPKTKGAKGTFDVTVSLTGNKQVMMVDESGATLTAFIGDQTRTSLKKDYKIGDTVVVQAGSTIPAALAKIQEYHSELQASCSQGKELVPQGSSFPGGLAMVALVQGLGGLSYDESVTLGDRLREHTLKRHREDKHQTEKSKSLLLDALRLIHKDTNAALNTALTAATAATNVAKAATSAATDATNAAKAATSAATAATTTATACQEAVQQAQVCLAKLNEILNKEPMVVVD